MMVEVDTWSLRMPRDHRADHEQHDADGGKGNQHRCDVEHRRQDQAQRDEDLERSDGPDLAGTHVLDPTARRGVGELLHR